MTPEMQKPYHTSTVVDSFGFEPIKSGLRGNIHIQFRDKEGNLTGRGYFANCQRALFAGLRASMKPGKFINENLRNQFEWVALNQDGTPAFNGDDYQNPLAIPADCPNTIEAIEACYETQRIKPKGGLFT